MPSTEFAVKYGAGSLAFGLPDTADVTVIEPRAIAGVSDSCGGSRGGTRRKLIEQGLLRQPGRTAITISDATRPVPNEVILPPLLAELHARGVDARDICIVVGTGNHRPATAAEFPRLVGADIAQRCRVLSHVHDDAFSACPFGHDESRHAGRHQSHVCHGGHARSSSA